MSIDTSIVRIRTPDRTVVGAGFLVDQQHIFTCAHVVTQALGLPEETPNAPSADIWLDFPLVAPKKLLTAKVVRWYPKLEDESGDIAVLQLQADLPTGAEEACLAEAEDVWEHPFRVFGFPQWQDDGVWATGRLLGRQATNWIMMEDVKTPGFAVVQGFSGSPVWDTQLQGVVGMVVASVRPTTVDTKTAFVIPLDVLTAVWEIESPIVSQRVFLSSAPDDAAFAEQLRTDLSARGIVVWNEQQGPERVPANKKGERLQQAIRSVQALALVVSSQTRTSRVVREHLRLANLYRRPLILVWVGDDPDTRPYYYGWRETTWIDVHQTPYPSVLEIIKTSLSQDRLTSITALLEPTNKTSWPEPRNPYKGLRAFTEEDTCDFFGRDRLVNDLLQKVQELLVAPQATPLQERLLTLIGPSGSGKSSVLLAGLLPRLRSDALPDSEHWIYLKPIVPGKHPLEALALTLKPYFSDSSIKTLREDLEDDAARGLHLLSRQLALKSDARVVLLVDQFEELFTQTASEAERQQFIDLLLTAATEPRGPTLILLTLRADFYDRLTHYKDLARLIDDQNHHVLVFPMDMEDLRAVIEKPAALPDVRLTFEGNLIGDLLFEVQGQVGILPLLQFTLAQLFQHRSGHLLTLQAYHKIGGVRGALTQHAEQIYIQLPSEGHHKLARALFLRLIEPGATERDTTRRRAALTEFVFEDATQTRIMQETLDVFVAARLLTTSKAFDVKTLENPVEDGPGNLLPVTDNPLAVTTVEVSHEAVIREWPRLATWLQEARQDIPLQQAVSEDVAAWEQRGKPGDRLYRGTQLKEAQAWARRNLVSEKEQAFLRASASQRWRSVVTAIMLIFLVVTLSGTAGWFVLHQPPDPRYVTNTNDEGIGSLRWAIANTHTGDTITFDPHLVGKTIGLKSADLHTGGKVLKIQGLGRERLTIRGKKIGKHNSSLVIDSGASVIITDVAFKELFLFNEGGRLTLTNSSISGISTDSGISNSGTLTLTNSTVSGNTGGGGISNGSEALLTVTNCIVSGNLGGGIYNDGTVTVTNSTVSGNTGDVGGGGIDNSSGTVIVTNSTISGNTSDSGGGIYNSSGTLTITNSTVADNKAFVGRGGGIYNYKGTLTMANSTVSGNKALEGSIYNYQGTVTVTTSTVSGNTAKSGGGILNNSGTLTMINSTVAGNKAESGGGIYIETVKQADHAAKTDLIFSTIYDNGAPAGADIVVEDVSYNNGEFKPINQLSQLKIRNSIVAGSGPDILGRLISYGYNLFQSNSGATFDPSGKQHDTDKTLSMNDLSKLFAAPMGLQRNGGLTETYKLLSSTGNPAISAIPLNVCHTKDIFDKGTKKHTDQRGMPRPGGKKQRCDIGAYESSD